MRRLTILTAVLLIVCGPSHGQPKSRREINVLWEHLHVSKPDSNTINSLHALGKSYLLLMSDQFTANKAAFFDTAVNVFKRSVALSDSLHLIRFKNESLALLGGAYLMGRNEMEGRNCFMQIIRYQQLTGDKDNESRYWLRYGLNIRRDGSNFAELHRAFDSSLILCRQIKNIQRAAAVKVEIADLYYCEGKLDRGEKELLEAFNLYQSIGYKHLCDVYYLLSVINRYQGEYNNALSYALKCIQTMESLKDTASSALFTGEMGLVYEGLNKPEESIGWYTKSLLKRQQSGASRIVIYRTAGFLVQQYIKINQAKKALALLLGMFKRDPPQTILEKAAYTQNMAYCYDALEQYAVAEKYYTGMIREYESAADDGFLSIAYGDMGRFYVNRHQYDRSRYFLKAALETTNLLARQKDLHLMFFTADSACGDYISAIRHLQMHKALNDSIFNDKKMKQIEELQISYQTARREKDILLLNNQSKLQQDEMQRSAWIRNIIIAGVLLLAGFSYSRYRIKQQSNEKLEAQQKVINQKNASLQDLVNEKEWLIKEIHHRVKNNFHMVIGLLGTQSGYLKNEEAVLAMQDSQHRVHAMSLIHQKLYQSDNLSAINMPDYIHELVEYLRDAFDTRQRIIYNVQVDQIVLDISHSLPIGLILNEAITNSIKYAFPGKREGVIDISLQKEQNNILLIIADNGIGLSTAFDKHKNSMGMNLMQGLSEDLGGDFTISGNKGTIIKIVFEYDPALPYGQAGPVIHQTFPA